MKILKAWIDDPTLKGVIAPPVLFIETDAYPDRHIEPQTFSGGWTVSKYGPFTNYVNSQEPNADAGDFNIRFSGRFPPVVDIGLVVEDKSPRMSFALTLTRARQLLRKHDRKWRLYVSDKEAQSGALLWVPQQVEPVCRYWSGMAGTCGESVNVSFTRYKGVDLPLCAMHMIQHNSDRAEERRASNTSK